MASREAAKQSQGKGTSSTGSLRALASPRDDREEKAAPRDDGEEAAPRGDGEGEG